MKTSLAAPKSVRSGYSSSGSTRCRLSTFALLCSFSDGVGVLGVAGQREQRLGHLVLGVAVSVVVLRVHRR